MKAIVCLAALVLMVLMFLGSAFADSDSIYGIYFWQLGANQAYFNNHGAYSVEMQWPGVEGITDWSSLRSTVQNVVNNGLTPIVRMDWQNPYGTAPPPGDYAHRQSFALACRSCVAAIGDLCHIWFIGNEMNLNAAGETPADWYLSCFNGSNGGDPVYNCYTQIHSQQSNAIVCMGPVAPWSSDTNAAGPYDNTYEMWKNYWYYLVNHSGANVDGWAIHSYGGGVNGQPSTSGFDPDARDDCNAPMTVSTPTVDLCYNFNQFRYFTDEVATAEGDLNKPIFITETDTAMQDSPSTTYQPGWMQSAYEAVDTYNKNHYQKIHSLNWFTYGTAGAWTDFSLCCGGGNMVQANTDYQNMCKAENYQWASNTPDAYIYRVDTNSSNPNSTDPNQIVLSSYQGKYEAWQGTDVSWPAAAPTITNQPVAQSICSNSTATFSVSASGNPDPTYQWRLNGNNISGATSTSYATNVAGSYDCVATNSYGAATSNAVSLTVYAAPSITTQPTSATIASGTTTTFMVAASGMATLTYRWQFNGSDISGATSTSYTTSVAGNYNCVVTNSCGSVGSNTATLTLYTPVSSVAAAKALPDGTVVVMSLGPVVTRSYPGSFYFMEDVDRTAGIKIVPTGSVLARGSTATILGTMATSLHDRIINAATASDISTGTVPGGLGMTCNLASMNLTQGLLVRLWGVATVAQGATTNFTINDGSGSITVSVYGVTLPKNKAFVNVRGIYAKDTKRGLTSALRINDSGDIW